MVLGCIYNNVGFNQITDDILHHLITVRVPQPYSKMAIVEYLKSYYDEDVDLRRIYRHIDTLHKTQKEQVHRISVENTRKLLGSKVG